MRIYVDVNTKGLQQQVKIANEEIKKQLPFISGKGASSFADNAAAKVPPKVNGQFVKNIPNKLYRRQIKKIRQSLEALRKISRNNKTSGNKKRIKAFRNAVLGYADALKKGYKFMIHGVQNFQKKTFFYKSKQMAKQYERIANRGLMKVMFGASLTNNNFVPKTIQKLLMKSPNLRKFAPTLNPIVQSNTEDESTMQMQNRAGNLSDKYVASAMQNGRYYAIATMKKQAELCVKKVVQFWNNKK